MDRRQAARVAVVAEQGRQGQEVSAAVVPEYPVLHSQVETGGIRPDREHSRAVKPAHSRQAVKAARSRTLTVRSPSHLKMGGMGRSRERRRAVKSARSQQAVKLVHSQRVVKVARSLTLAARISSVAATDAGIPRRCRPRSQVAMANPVFLGTVVRRRAVPQELVRSRCADRIREAAAVRAFRETDHRGVPARTYQDSARRERCPRCQGVVIREPAQEEWREPARWGTAHQAAV